MPAVPFKSSLAKHSTAGFTSLEALAILVILGIFTAIAAPAWLAFINHQRLRLSADRVYWAMRIAQSNAKRDKSEWQATFRQTDRTVQWMIHPPMLPVGKTLKDFPQSPVHSSGELIWHDLAENIVIDTKRTTLTKVDIANTKRNSYTSYYRALFSYKGCPVMGPGQECGPGGLGKITIYQADLGSDRRYCTIISTLLGAMRTDEGKRCK